MKKLMIWTVACSALSVAAAAAADLPTRKPAPPMPYIAPVTNWGGFYIGANGGYGWDPANATFDPATYATSALATTGPFKVTGASPTQYLSVHPQGWLGGGQIGYNWQQANWVYGLEADIDWSGMKGSTSAPFFVNGTIGGDIANFTGNVGLEQKVDYFGTARGRLGWANDSMLFFGTGGLAWGQVKTSFNTFGIATTPGDLTTAQLAALRVGASASNLRPGFAVGGGVEWKVAPHWSVKAEYLFVDLLGGETLSIPGGSAKAGSVPVQVARVGVNYFFGQ
jgi:outer membrane immunogenic protein